MPVAKIFKAAAECKRNQDIIFSYNAFLSTLCIKILLLIIMYTRL